MCGKALRSDAVAAPIVRSARNGVAPQHAWPLVCPRRFEPPGSAGTCPADCALRAPKPRRYVASGHQETGAFPPARPPVTHNRKQNSSSRGLGEYVHVAVDDHSRVSFFAASSLTKAAERLPGFVAGIGFYRTLGVTFKRVLTDNGACYRSRRFARLCRRLGLRHMRTKFPIAAHQWQGGALHPDCAAGMGVVHSYESSDHRAQHLLLWLAEYKPSSSSCQFGL